MTTDFDHAWAGISADARRNALKDLCATFDPLLEEGASFSELRPQLLTFAVALETPVEGLTDAELWRNIRERLDVDGVLAAEADRTAANILVVEDDPDVSASVVDALVEAGHRVVAAASRAKDASALAQQHALDLAVVDVHLEDSDGRELASQLKSRWDTPVLIISGSDVGPVEFSSFADAFLAKPFRTSELISAVDLAMALGVQRLKAAAAGG